MTLTKAELFAALGQAPDDAEIKVEVMEVDKEDATVEEGQLMSILEETGGWRQVAGCYVIGVAVD